MGEAVDTNKVGKRYQCSVCSSEFIVTKAGTGQTQPLSCHGRIMAPK